MGQCYNCKTELPDRVDRSTECSSCSRDARVCKNCVFYSPGSHYDCKESIDDEVRDKESRNFCDYFKIKPSLGGRSGAPTSEDAKAKFNSLFGD